MDRSNVVLFEDLLPAGQTIRHHMMKVQWEVADAEGRKALEWWYHCEERLMRTVAAFQPGRVP